MREEKFEDTNDVIRAWNSKCRQWNGQTWWGLSWL